MNLHAAKIKGFNLNEDNPFSISDFKITQPYHVIFVISLAKKKKR